MIRPCELAMESCQWQDFQDKVDKMKSLSNNMELGMSRQECQISNYNTGRVRASIDLTTIATRILPYLRNYFMSS